MLRDAGVWALDIAGAGGTSWAKIERYIRAQDDSSVERFQAFDNWGIPTADSLVSVSEVVKDIPLIASGGIRNGLEMAMAITLGASYVGMALPLLSPAVESHEAVREKIRTTIDEFKAAMFCCAQKNVRSLRQSRCIQEIKR